MKNKRYNFTRSILKLGLNAYHKNIRVYGLGHVPKDKPVLFLPNHQNALIDALLVGIDFNRKPFFLTRSDVFGKPLLNSIFKVFRMLPIYRMRDGKGSLVKNDAIFDTCADVLGSGEALVMFPEANHNLKRRVRPLSKGFTRILFRTLEKYPRLDIHIVPVGLNYKEASGFPDEVAIYFGKSIAVQTLLDANDLSASARTIKNMVSKDLKNLTTHIEKEEHYEEVIQYLNHKNVNYLKPKKVNQLIASYVPNGSDNKFQDFQRKGYGYFLILLLNLPVVLLWKFFIKPKVKEQEFKSTLRFATAMLGFSLYFLVILISLTIFSSLPVALGAVLALFAFNWLLVKYA